MRSTDPPADLTTFPRTVWPAGRRAHRVYRHTDPVTGTARTPLYFTSGTGAAWEGRWDPPEPEGACYLADDVVVCVLEVLAPDLPAAGPPRLAAETWLWQRRRIELLASADVGPFADLDSEEAFGFGVAGDLHTTDDRALTQAWAAAMRAYGHLGMRAHARTPPAGDAGTWTLFGPAGPAAAPPDGRLRLRPPRPLRDDAGLLHRLRDHGVGFLPVPNDVPTD